MKLRSIIHQAGFDAAAASIFGSPWKADDRLRAIELLLAGALPAELARFPCSGTSASGRKLLWLKTPPGFLDPVVIIFSIDPSDQTAYLEEIYSAGAKMVSTKSSPLGSSARPASESKSSGA